jgi:Domain of unknown function (DUF4388)
MILTCLNQLSKKGFIMLLQGDLSDLPLIDMLYIFTSQRKQGFLLLTNSDWEAEIIFSEGNVCSASVYHLTPNGWKLKYKGEEALLNVLAWSVGQFRFEISRVNTFNRNLNTNWQVIVNQYLAGRNQKRGQNLAKAIPRQRSDVSLNVQMSLELEDWRLLFQANGQDDLTTIAGKLQVPVAKLISWFEELEKKGLIEFEQKTEAVSETPTPSYTIKHDEGILWYRYTSISGQVQTTPPMPVLELTQKLPTLPAPNTVAINKPKVSRGILAGIMTKIRGL